MVDDDSSDNDEPEPPKSATSPSPKEAVLSPKAAKINIQVVDDESNNESFEVKVQVARKAPIPSPKSISSPSPKPRMGSKGKTTTMVQFEREWTRTKGDADAFYAYFKTIPPETYGKVFKELREDHLLTIFKSIRDKYVPDQKQELAVDVLTKLAATSRFSLLIMMLETETQRTIADVFGTLAAWGGLQPKDLAKLKGHYE